MSQNQQSGLGVCKPAAAFVLILNAQNWFLYDQSYVRRGDDPYDRLHKVPIPSPVCHLACHTMSETCSDSIENNLNCSICLDMFTNPLSLACGHTFCQKCIHGYWDRQETQLAPTDCPTCRVVFEKRPEPQKNVILSKLVEDQRLKRTHSLPRQVDNRQNVSKALCRWHNQELVYYCRTEKRCTCPQCMLRSCLSHQVEQLDIQSRQEKEKISKNLLTTDLERECTEEAIKKWNRKSQSIKEFHDKLVSLIDTKFDQVKKALEASHTLVIESVRGDEQAAMKQATEHQVLLHRHLEALKKHHAEAEQLLQKNDAEFLEALPLLVPVERAPVPPNTQPSGNLQMEAINKTLPEITRLIHDELLNALHPEIPHDDNKENSTRSGGHMVNTTCSATKSPGTSPNKLKTVPGRAPGAMSALRRDLCKDYRNLTFDPETANKYIRLSNQDCKASHETCTPKHAIPESSKRFKTWQVMCTDGFSEGKHYWEVEVSEFFVELGVAYGSLQRTDEQENVVGRNKDSWGLQLRSRHHSAWHDNKEIQLQAPKYKKMGIHLNCTAGNLSFYGIADGSLECLHTFSCLFIDKVYPIYCIGEGTSVTLYHTQNCPMNNPV